MATTAGRKALSVGNSLYRGRTLRILITPTPTTFSERRSVLKVLEQHGPIEVFRMTPGYHSNYMSVTKSSETADRLVAASPLMYSVMTGQKSPSMLLADLPPAPAEYKALPPSLDSPDSDESEGKKEFILEVRWENDYNHTGTFDQSALHGTWPTSFTDEDTFMSNALKQSLPDNIAATGLSRWEKDAEVRGDRLQKKERLQLKTWVPSKILNAVRTEEEQVQSTTE